MYSVFWSEFAKLLLDHNQLSGRSSATRQSGGLRHPGKPYKTVGIVTRHTCEEMLRQLLNRLFDLGYRFKHPRNLKPKHVEALVRDWVDKGYSASRVQNFLSALRCFSAWIGKADMVGPTEHVLREAGVSPDLGRRAVVTRQDKSWTAQGIDPCTKIVEVAQTDTRVACVLTLQLAFGLRMREASCLRPHLADQGTSLAVDWGTKGKREREYPNVTHDGQRETIKWAKSFAPTANSSMILDGMDWKAWHNRFYYVCRKHGIKRTDEIVPHGLRHQHLNDLYQTLTGQRSPVRLATQAPSGETIAVEYARQVVAEVAGHTRKSVSGAYLGQFLPGRAATPATESEPVAS